METVHFFTFLVNTLHDGALHALDTCMIVPCARWETRDPQLAANFLDDKGAACSDGDWNDDSDDEGEAHALNAEARRITKTHPHPNPRARVRARARARARAWNTLDP